MKFISPLLFLFVCSNTITVNQKIKNKPNARLNQLITPDFIEQNTHLKKLSQNINGKLYLNSVQESYQRLNKQLKCFVLAYKSWPKEEQNNVETTENFFITKSKKLYKIHSAIRRGDDQLLHLHTVVYFVKYHCR